MALATLNGLTVFKAVVHLPRLGVWHADVEADVSEAPLSGPLTLSLGEDLELSGVALRQAQDFGVLRVRLVGGAGGLGATATPKGYGPVPLKLPLVDLLTGAGEALSPSSSAPVLSTPLPRWQTLARTRGIELAGLLRRAPEGTAWRMLPDGTFWVGEEAWPAAQATYEVLARDSRIGRWLLGVEAPSLLPGQVLEGQHISDVTHAVTPEAVRTTLWMEN